MNPLTELLELLELLEVVTQREPRAWPCYADHGLYRYLNLLEGLHTPITCYHTEIKH